MASKVLLVEDDNNLREIYQARLQAEGYDIVSAKDGEEALVIAKQEQPDLIISDVMMPRVSGFEMLDILRNTEGLKDPKVIMLTALGQADDKSRADKLGADRYLVKSQVTLEDIVKAAQDLLNGGASDDDAAVDAMTASITTETTDEAPAIEPTAPSNPVATATPVVPVVEPPVAPQPVIPAEPAVAPTPAPEPVPVATPVVAAPTPVSAPAPVATPVVATTTDAPIEPDAVPEPTPPGVEPVVTEPVEASPSESSPNDQLIADALKDLTSGVGNETIVDTAAVAPQPVIPAEPAVAPTPAPEPVPVATPVVAAPTPVSAPAPVAPVAVEDDNDASTPVAHKKVISPISAPNAVPEPDINELLAKEEAKEEADAAVVAPPAAVAPQPVIPAEPAVAPTPAPEPVPVATPVVAAPTPAPEPVADIQTEASHQPGNVISPTPSTAPSSAAFDEGNPSNIAL
jgi:CheY-like chemotaxis protein